MFDFGVRIKQLRISRHMSQATLGKKLDRSKSVICSYENNVRIPPLDVLVKMAVIFNVSLDYLIGIDKNEMISISKLDDEQKQIIRSLLKEFESASIHYLGITENQQKLVSRIFIQFLQKNK